MASSRARSILGIFSLISLMCLTYFLSRLSFKINPNDPFYLDMIGTLILGFNIPILFGWIAFGVLGGLAICILSIVIVSLLDLRMGLYGYSALTSIFLATIFIGYRFSKLKNIEERSHSLKLEKLSEDENILSNEIKDKRNNILSLEEKLKRYSALREVVESLSTDLSVENVNRVIIEEVLRILGKSGRILLFLVDTEIQELVLSASRDASGTKAKRGDIFDHWVLRYRKSLIIEDIKRDFRFPADDIEESKKIFSSLISVPLTSENKVIGVLRMDSPEEFLYTQDDLRLFDIISDLGAVAINNALLYSRTQELAIKDSLTGLVVRRYFMERFKEEIERSARKKGTLSLLLLDIDYFKDYNDKYGHAAGDLVLKYLAQIINSVVREGDIVARYGGEEMAVLLCERNRDQAKTEAENIRRTIKDKPLIFRRQPANVTVSIGLSGYPEDALFEEELIRVADGRLYKAKALGRDRVCSG